MKITTVLKVVGALILVGILVGCAPKKAPPSKPTAATEQALAKAEQCISQAKQLGVTVEQAQQVLDQANQAAQIPNDQKAQNLSSQVCRQTDAAINAYYLDKARALEAQAQQYTNLSTPEQSQMQQGETEITNNRGKNAYDTLSALVSQLQSAQVTYTVASGDTLWSIAGKSSTYNNPYEWALIYLYNANKINDPDLIFPNQQLTVPLHPTKAQVESAITYAKTRGPWENGQALGRDHAWLASQQPTMNSETNGGSGTS